MRHSGVKAALGSVLISAMAVTACSSNAPRSASSGTPAGSGNAARSAPTNTPVSIMVAVTLNNPALSTPEYVAGAQARANILNQSGGLNGHPIKIVVCDENADPNLTTACARQAASDKVIAVTGNILYPGPWPILAAANIPVIGAGASTPQELQSPVAFENVGNGIQDGEGLAVLFAEAGATKISAITCAAPAACFNTENAMNNALKVGGKPSGKVFTFPLSATDYTSVAAAAIASGANAIAVTGTSSSVPNIIKALRQQGFRGLIGTGQSELPQNVIAEMGAAAEGVLVSGRTLPPSAAPTVLDVANFLAAMKTYAPTDKIDDLSAEGWGNVGLIDAVSKEKHLTTITSSTLLQAFDTLNVAIPDGICPPFQVAGLTSPYPGEPRLLKVYAALSKVENGIITLLPSSNNGFVVPLDIMRQMNSGA